MEINARTSFNKDVIKLIDNQEFPIKYNNKIVGNGTCLNGMIHGIIEDKEIINLQFP